MFGAIAHPVRRDLLEAMREAARPLSITELGARCEVSRSTASRHLDILRGAGMVVARSAQPAVLHELDPTAFAAIESWLWPFVESPVGAGT
ncbi:ArsR/SmtB family transcription factor [Agromyces luteolus]|uniref:ArsR/SmtB family transcription factor n=1 Tax=Agromyces luteolus TaxID=88373 RepID=UPI0022F332AB|nr:winged helix-turn-helix domain-containing protein [Agromyces luteolus]